MNHGGKVERLRGNIGYLEFFNFADEELGADTVAAAMNFVNGTDALIIDMRAMAAGIRRWWRWSVLTCSVRSRYI